MEINTHGKNVFQARIAVQSALKRATNADYRLRVVHGYQNGTAIRNKVRDEFARHPRVLRIENTRNPGETILVLREY